MSKIVVLCGIFVQLINVSALNNGVARTPPMGWLSWAKFGCDTDCKARPNDCISENLYTAMADLLVSDGYLDVGYNQVNIDDCWPALQRDSNGQLIADPTRFPHGIQWLASYMHDRGLKLGIYEDFGNLTCAGYPGSLNHLQTDADTFASWGVDMLKLDGCNVPVSWMPTGYPLMETYLNATNRPIIFSCSWPAYEPNYTEIAQSCNLWRNYDDISLSWLSVQNIIDWYSLHQNEMILVNGPGQWNDPDMLIIGNIALTVDQAQVQMALWSIWSAPLLMSNDLRKIEKKYKDILLNKQVIAVNQDPLGIMGRLVMNNTDVSVYAKPMTPYDDTMNMYSYAIVIFNRNVASYADFAVQQISSLGLVNPNGYNVQDLFTNETYGILYPTSSFHCRLKPTSVVMIKATLVMSNKIDEI